MIAFLLSLALLAPSPPAAAPTVPVIGYIGCSNTARAVAGAWAEGFTRLWPSEGWYGGGTIQAWASGEKWRNFDVELRRYPTTTFWFELCELGNEHISEGDSLAKASAVINLLRQRVPTATVYVSAVNDYVAPHVSPKLGPSGPANMRAVAADLVARGRALAGPNMGALVSAYQIPSAGATLSRNETEPDGTHPNLAGQAKLGAILAAFFRRINIH